MFLESERTCHVLVDREEGAAFMLFFTYTWTPFLPFIGIYSNVLPAANFPIMAFARIQGKKAFVCICTVFLFFFMGQYVHILKIETFNYHKHPKEGEKAIALCCRI